MPESYLFEEYNPQKFENQLKGIQQLDASERQKILLDTLLNPTSYFFTPVFADKKGFRLLRTKDGKSIFPIYTSLRKAMKDPSFDVSARTFRGNMGYYGPLFEQNADLFGIMLNFTPDQSGIFISRESILQIKDVYEKRITAIRERAEGLDLHAIHYEIPGSEIQTICQQAAASVLKQYTSCTACWVRHSFRTDDASAKDRHLVYIVDMPELSEADRNTMTTALAAASTSALRKDETVEVILKSSNLGTRLTTDSTPIYTK